MGNGMLSQEEIDALLRGPIEADAEQVTPPIEDLDEMEKDTLGEIANISMGTAATTLSQLLNKKVEITTPEVDLTTSEQVLKDYPVPSVICDVKYKAGIEGSNLLILSQRDGSVIVDLMMGGDGKDPSPELSELQISGISEAMNQMMGSAATSMSTMFNAMVDITPPNLVLTDLTKDKDVVHDLLHAEEPLVRISFRMVVEDVIDSKLLQVIPLSVAKGMVNKLMGVMAGGAAAAPAAQTAQTTAQAQPQPQPVSYQTPPSSSPPAYEDRRQTSVQPAQFAPLQPGPPMGQPNNLSLIMDVPLQISVELGRAQKTIKDILEMGPGSVIELDRLAGESVDMIVNGKLIAKCEVIVINETFGIRITDIVHPLDRINSLK